MLINSLDEDWKRKKEETGFAPPDRPKKWRRECRETIKSIAYNRIHGCKIEGLLITSNLFTLFVLKVYIFY